MVSSARVASAAQHDDGTALWTALAVATDAGAFCRAWLALQCARTPGARSALVLLETAENNFAPAAIWPAQVADAALLRGAAERALGSGHAVVEPLAEQSGLTVIAYPVSGGGRVHGAVVLAIADARPQQLQTTLRELHWGVGWLVSMAWQQQADEGSASAAAAAAALGALAAMGEHDSLTGAAVALCNTLALELDAERVSFGLVADDRVRLAATSHGAWSGKRSDIAETLEAAMEEALDQATTVTWPAVGDTTAITLQQQRLAASAARSGIASVPVADRGLPVGVLAVERGEAAGPLAPADLLLLEAVAALAAPLLAIKRREERWISGRVRAHVIDGARALFGPRRPLAKTLGIAAVVALLLLLLPIWQFRIGADAVLEGRVRRAAAVPFSGFIARSQARAGDVVREGQVLATLDDRDLRIDHARSRSAVEQLDRRYREALADHKRAEMNLFGAQLRQSEAELSLIEYKLARTNITAPLSGVLVSGDVSQLVGTPVQEGQVLFEVSPTEGFRVVLQADEADISYLRPGQRGRFAPAGLGGETVPFRVTKLTSVTASEDGRNTFRVEAELPARTPVGLRPGMEGVAKVSVGRASALWSWTRSLRNWLRLFAWKWMP